MSPTQRDAAAIARAGPFPTVVSAAAMDQLSPFPRRRVRVTLYGQHYDMFTAPVYNLSRGEQRVKPIPCEFCGKKIGETRYWAVKVLSKREPETCSSACQHKLAVYRARGVATPAERAKKG